MDGEKIKTAAMGQSAWQTPTVRKVGTITEVLQGGGGKLSATAGDPGETRKQKPTG